MKSILIADDSLFMRQMLKELLPRDKFFVIGEASTGKEALAKYSQLNPDLVTMDITMPDMDGITAVKHIIKEDKEAKIIMVTSHGQEDMVIKSIQAGAVGYILKPISEDKMAQVIGEVFIEYATQIDEDELGLTENDL